MSFIKVHNLSDKIHEDNRGWVANLAEYATGQGRKIENIHAVSIMPGQIRGNHFHKKQKEWIVILGGKAVFAWKSGKKIKKKKLSKNARLLFEVNPKCSHAVKNIDKRNIYLCAFTDTKYNFKNPDAVIDKII